MCVLMENGFTAINIDPLWTWLVSTDDCDWVSIWCLTLAEDSKQLPSFWSCLSPTPNTRWHRRSFLKQCSSHRHWNTHTLGVNATRTHAHRHTVSHTHTVYYRQSLCKWKDVEHSETRAVTHANPKLANNKQKKGWGDDTGGCHQVRNTK